MPTITLRNNFHNSEVTLRVSPGQTLSRGQMQRARQTLCGIKDCTCGNDLGMRGPNPSLVLAGLDQNGRAIIRRPRTDESEEWLATSGWAY